MTRDTKIVGHQSTIRDLKNLAASGRLSHGYLFHGPSMVGKRTAAMALAKFLEKGEFETWREEEVLQDAGVFDMSFAKRLNPERKNSIGIDVILKLKDFLWRKPAASSRRTAIVDGGELLTAEAQNALLRIAEEPPPSALLIIVTSDPEGALPTLLSRLHKVYFSQISGAEFARWLESGTGVDGGRAKGLAQKSFGKPGLALSLLNDAGLRMRLKAAERLMAAPVSKRRDFIKKLIEPEGFSFSEFLDAMILYSCAGSRQGRVSPRPWHRLLKLKGRTSSFALNPRLQLEAVMAD